MSEFQIDQQSESGIPWASRTSWRAANQAVVYHLKRYPMELQQLETRAQALKSCLNAVFYILDNLCAHSCPWCPEPCCLSASVWFDLKDLLFLQFNQLPPSQPKSNLSMPCCYLSPKGCRLPRLARPWICTWYLCPTQTAKLGNGDCGKRKSLNQAFDKIKSGRNRLESEYIRIIS